MEQARKVIKQPGGVSQYVVNGKGHVAIESPYYGLQLKMSNSKVATPFASFIKSMALYDAIRDTNTYYSMMGKFYEALSNVQSEQDLMEIQQAFQEVKAMGGVAVQVTDVLVGELNMEKVQHAETFANSYNQMSNVERNIIKEKSQAKNTQQIEQQPELQEQVVQDQTQVPQEQLQTQEQEMNNSVPQDPNGTQDPGSSVDAGARSQTDKAEVATRIAASENKEKVNYQLHIPVGTSGKMINHMQRLYKVIQRYSKRPDPVYEDEFEDEMKKTLESLDNSKDYNNLISFLEDQASQGELGRKLCSQYAEMLTVERNKVQEGRNPNQSQEFVEMYQNAMVAFDKFNNDRMANGIDTDRLDNTMFLLSDLDKALEEHKESMSKEDYEKYKKEIQERLKYLDEIQKKIDQASSKVTKIA